LTASGTIGIFQPPSPSLKSTIGSGEMTPWSTSSSWQIVMSNSSATSERAMCHPSLASPGSGGNGREPKPSSATGYTSATPSAKVGYAFRKAAGLTQVQLPPWGGAPASRQAAPTPRTR
jgi:hypothetical protein